MFSFGVKELCFLSSWLHQCRLAMPNLLVTGLIFFPGILTAAEADLVCVQIRFKPVFSKEGRIRSHSPLLMKELGITEAHPVTRLCLEPIAGPVESYKVMVGSDDRFYFSMLVTNSEVYGDPLAGNPGLEKRFDYYVTQVALADDFRPGYTPPSSGGKRTFVPVNYFLLLGYLKYEDERREFHFNNDQFSVIEGDDWRGNNTLLPPPIDRPSNPIPNDDCGSLLNKIKDLVSSSH